MRAPTIRCQMPNAILGLVPVAKRLEDGQAWGSIRGCEVCKRRQGGELSRSRLGGLCWVTDAGHGPG